MELMFLGTGAADYDWSKYGEPGVLGSTATLVDGRLLIDCGPTVADAFGRFGVNSASVEAVVFTHSHSDHFDLKALRRVAAGRRLAVFGPPSVCDAVSSFCAVHPLEYGSRFLAAGYEFLALPANHTAADVFERTFLYLVSGGGKNLLYALDTAWLPTLACRLLGKTRLDGAIWDATMSRPGDWRVFEHTDPVMFAMQRRALTDNGNFDANTRIWFDHRARTLWPADPAEQEAIARNANVLLAHDGERVNL